MKKPCVLLEELVEGTCAGTVLAEDVRLLVPLMTALLPTAWLDASTAAALNTTALVITRRFFQFSTRARVAAFAAVGDTAGPVFCRLTGAVRMVASFIGRVSPAIVTLPRERRAPHGRHRYSFSVRTEDDVGMIRLWHDHCGPVKYR